MVWLSKAQKNQVLDGSGVSLNIGLNRDIFFELPSGYLT